MIRKCDECSVCCYVGYVPELEKQPHVSCQYIKTSACGSCSLYNKENLPKTCKEYRCSWLNGYGGIDSRPDKSGVMITDNFIENQRYLTAIETKKDALTSEAGLKIVFDVIRTIKVPMLVVLFGQKPPTTGDQIIIHDDLLPRTKQIAGDLIRKHGDVGVYELVKGN